MKPGMRVRACCCAGTQEVETVVRTALASFSQRAPPRKWLEAAVEAAERQRKREQEGELSSMAEVRRRCGAGRAACFAHDRGV